MNEKMSEAIKEFLETYSEQDDFVDLEPYRTKENIAEIIEYIKSLGGKADLKEIESGDDGLVFFPFEFFDNVYVLKYNIFYNNDMKIYHEEDTREYFMKAKD